MAQGGQRSAILLYAEQVGPSVSGFISRGRVGRLFPKPSLLMKLKLFHSHPGEEEISAHLSTKPPAGEAVLWMVSQILESLKISFDCWAGIQTADG